jgi:hypothetical protein
MQNLCQLGVREAKLPAADSRHTSNGGVVERVAKGVSADHSRRADDYKTFLARRRNVYDSVRSSSQSTSSRRSANSHSPSVFTNVSK